MERIRNINNLKKELFNDEGLQTTTSDQQVQVEKKVYKMYHDFSLRLEIDSSLPKLMRWDHTKFLVECLSHLPSMYQSLDASRTWICYWILHALNLLNIKLPEKQQDLIIKFLEKCQCPSGGFGGGPGQMAHLATTYAAVNSLCMIGTKKALDTINREKLQNFLWDVRSSDGAFSMHHNGEIDVRGTYCALAVATLTNIYTEQLFDKTAEWVVRCQTYEGGFAGTPDLEAHGGYTFCGIATLFLLNKGHLCDTQALLRWIVNRQMRLEGGFQGRTNKLVDGCYSFWQGGAFPILHVLLGKEKAGLTHYLLNEKALQEYVLICCQHPCGGLLDKPGKPRDIYHTCYTLSGLSIAQHSGLSPVIVGSEENELDHTHPVYNISPEAVRKALSYYKGLEVPQCKIPS